MVVNRDDTWSAGLGAWCVECGCDPGQLCIGNCAMCEMAVAATDAVFGASVFDLKRSKRVEQYEFEVL
jgi:hypothetical protein